MKKMRQEVIDLEGHAVSIALTETLGPPRVFSPKVVITELVFDGQDLLATDAGAALQKPFDDLWKAYIHRIYCDPSGPADGCRPMIHISALKIREPWGEVQERHCYISINSKTEISSYCEAVAYRLRDLTETHYGTARPALRRVRFEAHDIAERSLILEVEEKEGPYKFFYPTLTPTVIMLDGEDITGTIADGVIRNSLQDFGDIFIWDVQCSGAPGTNCKIFIHISGTVIDPPPGALNTGGCSISIISKDETKGRCRPDYPEPENE